MTTAVATGDERLASIGIVRRLLVKPEFGSLIGAIVVFVFFAFQSDVFRSTRGVANWLDTASTVGLMAVPVALLMIGGHFDLSAGVQTGTAGLATGIMTTYWGLNVYASLVVSLSTWVPGKTPSAASVASPTVSVACPTASPAWSVTCPTSPCACPVASPATSCA